MKMQLTVIFQSNVSTICGYTIILNATLQLFMSVAYTTLFSITKSDSLSGKNQWTTSTWACNPNHKSGWRRPCNLFTCNWHIFALMRTAFSGLSKTILEQFMQENKKKYQDCTNGEGTCWSYNLDFILCLLMRIIIYVVVIQKWDWRYITMLYYLDRATLNFRRPLVCLTDFRILRVNGFSFIPKMNNVLLHAFPTVSTQNSCQLPVDKDQMRDTVIYG